MTVEGQVTGAIDNGFVALVGVTHSDTQAEAELLARKTVHLRVFEDADGKMNLSALDVGGGVLVISQFTLYADARKGRRPSFIDAARPEQAAPLVDYYADCLRYRGHQTGGTRRFWGDDAGRNPQRRPRDHHSGFG